MEGSRINKSTKCSHRGLSVFTVCSTKDRAFGKFRPMIFEYDSYRVFLKATLAERIAKNPKYSLRAFANGLGLSPSMLSMVNSGQRNLRIDHASRIARALGLGAREADYFSTLVQLETANGMESRQVLREKLRRLNPRRQVTDLPLDAFKVIADWYHFPILQMLKMKKFEFTPKNIARRLGVTPVEVETALERLVRLGILEERRGKYVRVTSDIWVNSEVPNTALRSFHREMLTKAIRSLEEQSPQEKYVGSETIAIDVQQLPLAKKMIEAFFNEMNLLFEKGKEPSEVYHFGVQLFRITRKYQ